MVIPDGAENLQGQDVAAASVVGIGKPVFVADKVIKLEEPEFSEEEVIVTPEEFSPALAEIDENIEINGIKIWPHVVEVVRLVRKPHARELYRKCTALVLKENSNMLDTAISRRIAAQFKCHGVTASRLTNYARRVKRRLPLSRSSMTVGVIDLDDGEQNSTEENFEEKLVKNKDLEDLLQTPHHIKLTNGPFHHVPIDRSEGSNDPIIFNFLFMEFVERMHKMYWVKVPDVDRNLLSHMVLQAFEGKRNISDIAGHHMKPFELRKVCNAVASMLHMYRNQAQMPLEKSICTMEFYKFWNKHCCPGSSTTSETYEN